MRDNSIPILVVDDTKFSSAFVTNQLVGAGYGNVVSALSAKDALVMLRQRPASILLADWMMPGMDGLELCARVRQLDEACNHFTYIILFTGKDHEGDLARAFDAGVDDFINKKRMQVELVPRVSAADRISNRHNRLLQAYALLLRSQQDTHEPQIIDPATGVGNARYAELRLNAAIRQCEGRGGHACYMMVRVVNQSDTLEKFGETASREVSTGIIRRLQQVLRPLDTLARLSEDTFAIIAHMATNQYQATQSLRRLYDSINQREFRAQETFIRVDASAILIVIDKTNAGSRPEAVMQYAEMSLALLQGRKEFEHHSWNALANGTPGPDAGGGVPGLS